MFSAQMQRKSTQKWGGQLDQRKEQKALCKG
jgi:hypothetical protein